MNADSSDDDDDVPEEWVSNDFSHLVVDDGSSVPSDCRENKIIQGARYHSIEEVKEAVKCWSLSLMRGVRGLPLVAIVEFIVRGCTDYFRDQFTKNQAFMQDPNRYFGKMMTEYMTKKSASAQLHHVRQCGTQELKFEVAPKDRARCGMRRQTPVKECILKFDGTYCCSCMRPKLLHVPCSHVMAACVDIRHPVDICIPLLQKGDNCQHLAV
jgi:hypothetical protein